MTEKQIQAAKMYAEGLEVTEISKRIGISRSTFYEWKKKKEFLSEVDRFKQEFLNSAEGRLGENVNKYIDALEVIAFCGKSEKNRTDALTYLLDRVLGKPTNRTQDITKGDQEEVQEVVSWDNQDVDNVLELKKRDVK